MEQRVKAAENEQMAPAPAQKCPRCESGNTKFCYYNNYSLSQPRYFCKACRRYWTHGGTLRNVPVGGGCRKPKRPKPPPEISRSQPAQQPLMPPFPPNPIISNGGSFLSSEGERLTFKPHQFHHNHYFPPRPSWINTPPTTATSSFWTDNQPGSSFNPDHINPGFDPSSSH